MSTWNYGQLEQLWLNTAKGTKYATKAWASLMAAIALAESSGEDQVVNSIGACGLWQIHPYQNGCKTPQANAKMALQKLQGQGLGAWETWTNGNYRKFLKGNVPPDANAPGGNTTTNQQPQSAQLASWNPIVQAISEFNPFLGQLISGFKGTPSGIGDLAGGVGGLVTDFATMIKMVSWLFVPQHWLRIVAFISGLLLLAGSAYMFKEAL
jgi:hypothetical protein